MIFLNLLGILQMGFMIAFPVAVIWGAIRLSKMKYGEWILFGMFTVFTVGMVWIYSDGEFSGIESRRNMRIALIQCGNMLKAGEKELLHRKLEALTASEAMKYDMYPFSKAFRETILPAPISGERTAPRGLTAFFFNVVLIWSVLSAIWAILYYCKYASKQRRLYLAALADVSLLALLLFCISNGVRNGYSNNGFKWDVQRLAEETARPEVRPELLPLLANPKEDGFQYLRKLPEPPKDKKSTANSTSGDDKK